MVKPSNFLVGLYFNGIASISSVLRNYKCKKKFAKKDVILLYNTCTFIYTITSYSANKNGGESKSLLTCTYYFVVK